MPQSPQNSIQYAPFSFRRRAGDEVKRYDAHGNMLTMPHLSNMVWDFNNRLFNTGNGTFSEFYNYDATGKRARKTTEKTNVLEERYYIGNYEVYRKFENGNLILERSTIHLMADTQRIATIDKETGGATLVRYQYNDHLGSACLVLNENAAIISYEEFHPFGTTSYYKQNSSISQKRYRYIGKERDEETGLYYYGARYYAAWIARFVSVDPLQHKYPYLTPYNYAGNKPITHIDIDGMQGTGDKPIEKNSSEQENEDIIIPVAWPDKRVDLTKETKFIEKLGIMDAKNGTIKAGHAGAILVDKSTGETKYFDYGRYVKDKTKGIVRDSKLKPSLELPSAIIDKNGNISNLNEILINLAQDPLFNKKGKEYGRMIASISKGINYEKSLKFATDLKKQGQTEYGPFVGMNCAKFVENLILKGDPSLSVRLSVDFGGSSSITPSPEGNVRLADTENKIYEVNKGKVNIENSNINKPLENEDIIKLLFKLMF